MGDPGGCPPATKGSLLRGYVWGSMVIVAPGVAPGYKRVAPTGLCVGFNGYCGPGGCTPGYKRVAPTGLCVGFNGSCCPGGASPATKWSPLRGYAWGSMVIVAPGVGPRATKWLPLRGYAWGSMVIVAPGGAPRLQNGRPYGAMRRVQLSVVRGYPSSLQGKRVIIWGNRVAVI